MGRNLIPRLGEWRDGEKYQFNVLDCGYRNLPPWPQPADGRMIVYEVERKDRDRKDANVERHVLATCFADGFQDCMASMWDSGFRKGVIEGERQKMAEIRRVLEITKD